MLFLLKLFFEIEIIFIDFLKYLILIYIKKNLKNNVNIFMKYINKDCCR